jgi:hypothetical protein
MTGMIRAANLLALLLFFQGCIIAPLRVANDLRVTVTDQQTGAPIGGAPVVYLVCDIHDFDCSNGRLVETISDTQGHVHIEGRRKWGVWIPTPGGLPVPNHTIAIWAPGYSAYVFQQYGGTIQDLAERIDSPAVRGALKRIPADLRSSDPALNPRRELTGGQIRLRPVVQPEPNSQLQRTPARSLESLLFRSARRAGAAEL